jgi:hypothetical protein
LKVSRSFTQNRPESLTPPFGPRFDHRIRFSGSENAGDEGTSEALHNCDIFFLPP